MSDTTRATEARLSHRASQDCDCQPCRDTKSLARELSEAQARIAALEGLVTDTHGVPFEQRALQAEAALSTLRESVTRAIVAEDFAATIRILEQALAGDPAPKEA